MNQYSHMILKNFDYFDNFFWTFWIKEGRFESSHKKQSKLYNVIFNFKNNQIKIIEVGNRQNLRALEKNSSFDSIQGKIRMYTREANYSLIHEKNLYKKVKILKYKFHTNFFLFNFIFLFALKSFTLSWPTMYNEKVCCKKIYKSFSCSLSPVWILRVSECDEREKIPE